MFSKWGYKVYMPFILLPIHQWLYSNSCSWAQMYGYITQLSEIEEWTLSLRKKHNKTSYLEVARDTQSAQITHK